MSAWTWHQATGEMSCNGGLIAEGYAGHAPYQNDPAAEWRPDLGPIPQGSYTIGPAQNHPRLGPVAMPLVPSPANVMFGRGDFWIHGDTADHNASCGCIVLDRDTRQLIAESLERDLTVVAQGLAPSPSSPLEDLPHAA